MIGLDSVYIHGRKRKIDQRERCFGGNALVPMRNADPVSQLGAMVSGSEAQTDASVELVIYNHGKNDALASFILCLMAANPSLGEVISIGIRDSACRLRNFLVPRDSLNIERIIEGERSENKSLCFQNRLRHIDSIQSKTLFYMFYNIDRTTAESTSNRNYVILSLCIGASPDYSHRAQIAAHCFLSELISIIRASADTQTRDDGLRLIQRKSYLSNFRLRCVKRRFSLYSRLE